MYTFMYLLKQTKIGQKIRPNETFKSTLKIEHFNVCMHPIDIF